MNKKKLALIAGVPLLLLLGGGGAFVAGVFDSPPVVEGQDDSGEENHDTAAAAGERGDEKHDAAVFYALPDIVVNLASTGRKGTTTYLKIKISLELDKADDQKIIEGVLPRVIDNLQVYLRELKIEDIQGSEGLYRLREELLHRVNVAATPAKINDVLFAEMLMQ